MALVRGDGPRRAQLGQDSMRTQVTFDAADPHSLAAFWASALGIEVEDHPDLVDQLVADSRMPASART